MSLTVPHVPDEFFSVIPTTVLSSEQKVALQTEKSNIDTEIIALSGKIDSIKVQKSSNEQLLSNAKASLDNAQYALKLAKQELTLLESGNREEKILAQKALLEQAKADLAGARANKQKSYSAYLQQLSLIKEAKAKVDDILLQLDKTVLKAPFPGIVRNIKVEEGETVTANISVLSMFSDKNFEVEAFVPEVDIAKIRLNDKADITLDAYGNREHFIATVIYIDPAEKMIEGVPTYKMLLKFNQKDDRIKSGMTANIDIVTDKRENVIIVPQRAVTFERDKSYVKILQDDNITVQKREVQTGLRGSDGNYEILRGVEVGEKVVLFEKG